MPEGATLADIFLTRLSFVARVNGELRDLAAVVSDGDLVEPVLIDSDEGRAVLRHPLLTCSPKRFRTLFPGTKLGIGPPVKDGFYYDFDPAEPFTSRGLGCDHQTDAADRQGGATLLPSGRGEADARAELADEPFKCEGVGLKGGAPTMT